VAITHSSRFIRGEFPIKAFKIANICLLSSVPKRCGV
jgi:hypothetical protein